MYHITKDKKCIIYVLLFIVSIIPFFLTSPNNSNQFDGKELFTPELSYLNSVNKSISYLDSIYLLNHLAVFDTAKYVQIASRFTKERFHYGLSHYSVSENWISYLSGKLLWEHLSAIVNPDDILKHSEGLCSQQTIVFMEFLMRKKINVRSVGLGYSEGPGHFLCEVYYNGGWHLHDVTKEPEWSKIENEHLSMEYYLSNKDSLYRAYQSKLEKSEFNKITERVSYGNVNEFPAKKMLFFHQATYVFTYFLPSVFLALFLYSYRKLRKRSVVNRVRN